MSVCEYCGAPLPPFKDTKRNYCTESCRQKLYRMEKHRKIINFAIEQNDYHYLDQLKIKDILKLGYNITIKQLTIGNLNEEGKLIAV